MALPATVLVADDEGLVRSMVRRFLEGDGCAVVEAADGEAAQVAVGQHVPPIELVVTYLKMTRLSGLEVLGALRQHRPELPVIVISGSGPSSQIQRVLADYGAPVLCKPFDRLIFTEAVRQAVVSARVRARAIRQQSAAARSKSARLRVTSDVLIATAHALQARFPWWGASL